MKSKAIPVILDPHFTAESGSAIPGHLIVRTQPAVLQLDELPPEALTALGPLLARLMAEIHRVVRPERIYLLRFGEEVEAIHFHLFPRTQAMGELYRFMHPEEKCISGAEMFDWARRPEILAPLTFPLAAPLAFEKIMEPFKSV